MRASGRARRSRDCGTSGRQSSPSARRRQDEVGVDAIVGEIDGDALVRLAPAAIDRDQRADQRGEQIERRNRDERQQRRRRSPALDFLPVAAPLGLPLALPCALSRCAVAAA